MTRAALLLLAMAAAALSYGQFNERSRVAGVTDQGIDTASAPKPVSDQIRHDQTGNGNHLVLTNLGSAAVTIGSTRATDDTWTSRQSFTITGSADDGR